MKEIQKDVKEIQEDTLRTIHNSLRKNRSRIRAILEGKVKEENGSLDEFYENSQELLAQFVELHAKAFNSLNDSNKVKDAIAALKKSSAEAQEEAGKVKSLTSKIDKFLKVTNDITNIVSKLIIVSTL